MFKLGFFAIIGRPNVGKSTLINKLINQKVSIISDKPQTTRNNIQGILNGIDYQMVFIDTPGIHKPKSTFGKMMNSSAWKSTTNVTSIIFLTEANTFFGKGDKLILENISQKNIPLFIILSKADLTNTEEMIAKVNLLKNYQNIIEILPISTFQNLNITKLVKLLKKQLKVGSKFYPTNAIVNKNKSFFIPELIREQILNQTSDELPYGTCVMLEDYKYDIKKKLHIISAIIFVERDSQKKILIGKQGRKIKTIGIKARISLQDYFKEKVYLNLFVKTKDKWNQSKEILNIYGYRV